MSTDYVKLAKIAQSKGYKRNLSSREIQGLKKPDSKSKALEVKKGPKKETKKEYHKRHFADLLKHETN